MPRNLRLIILLCILISVSVFAFLKYNPPTQNTTPASEVEVAVTPVKAEQTAELPNEIAKIRVTIEVTDYKADKEVTPGTTVYELLKELEMEGLHLEIIKYPTLGYYIKEIGTLKEGGGEYIVYYINGKSAETGISNYRLQSGDKIEFKQEKSFF